MDERPDQPVERSEVVERHETTERVTASPDPPPPRARGVGPWLWVALLVIVVGALAWYALSRGEPQQINLPEIDTPSLPEPEPTIEINVQEAPSQPAGAADPEAPSPAPTQPEQDDSP